MTTPDTTRPAAPLTPDAASVRGRFLWYDLRTTDVDRARSFYPAVTGWTVTEWNTGNDMPAYPMWTNAGTPLGGVVALSDADRARDLRPHWIPFVGTPDVDATYRDALAAGATSRAAPTDIPTIGRYAEIADPAGVPVALYQPLDAPPPSAEMPPVGAFSWHELATPDPEAAWEFYSRLFGWAETSTMDMGEMGLYRMYGRDGVTYGGMFNPGHAETPPHWMLYVRRPEMEAALAAVRANGGQVINGPMEVPGGDHVAQCTDPQGAMFAVHVTKHAA